MASFRVWDVLLTNVFLFCLPASIPFYGPGLPTNISLQVQGYGLPTDTLSGLPTSFRAWDLLAKAFSFGILGFATHDVVFRLWGLLSQVLFFSALGFCPRDILLGFWVLPPSIFF